MANIISDEIIDNISVLAQLELNEEEIIKVKTDMNKMIEYINKLNELDTTDEHITTHVQITENVFREDEVTNNDNRDNILKNAPHKEKDCFVVSKTVG